MSVEGPTEESVMDIKSVDDDQQSICSAGVFSDITTPLNVESDYPLIETPQATNNISQIRNRQKRAQAYIKLRRQQRKVSYVILI